MKNDLFRNKLKNYMDQYADIFKKQIASKKSTKIIPNAKKQLNKANFTMRSTKNARKKSTLLWR